MADRDSEGARANADPAGGPDWFRPFDVLVVVTTGVAASTVAGAVWSYARVGAVSWVFVREAQFVLGFVALAAWTVANRPGGRIRELDDGDEPFPYPDPERRLALYRRLGGRGAPSVADAPDRDVHVLALGVALCGLSLGVELAVLWRVGALTVPT